MDGDFTLNVRQIAQYQFAAAAAAADAILIQQGGIGGAYAYTSPAGIVGPAIAQAITTATLNLTGVGPIIWGQGQFLQGNNSGFSFNSPGLLLSIFPTGDATLTGMLSVGRDPANPFEVSTKNYVDNTVTAAKQFMTDNTVWTVNGKSGNVNLTWSDLIAMGGAPITSPVFQGVPTAPPISDYSAYDFQIATTQFVQDVVNSRLQLLLCCQPFVFTFNGRSGNVVLTEDDLTSLEPGGLAPLDSPAFTGIPTAPTAALNTLTDQLATCNYVANAITAFSSSGGFAPLASPNFSGVPTAPTAAVGSSTGQLATTAFVQAAVTASTTGVSSFNTRTGAVVLTAADLTGAGGALLASPVFTGTPSGPTATLGTSSTQLATTAFVQAQLAAGIVSSFNTRTGAVTLTLADVTGVGGAPITSPALTGTPTAATATAGTSTTQLATTAFVANAVAAIGTGVTSFEGRTGAVTLIANDLSAAGGALLAGPAFTGIPSAPTAALGTNTTQIATTAFVAAAAAAGGGVSSFNTRTGAVVLTAADLSAAGGALLASPIFTGIPLAPQAALDTATNQLATCSFVMAQIATGITSFNTRTGAVTLTLADVTGAGGAPLASPIFTGTPRAPSVAATTNTNQVANCIFVQSAIVAGSVASFNTRTGAVTLIGNDVSAAGGALLASPAFTGTPTSTTAVPGTNTTQIATTAFVMAAMAAGGGVTSFNGRSGPVTLTTADVSAAGGPYLPMTGGALTGALTATALTVKPASGGSNLAMQAAASGSANYISGYTAASLRWQMQIGNGVAESGGNVGSNFVLQRFSDTGVIIDAPFSIIRSSGQAAFSQALTIGGTGVFYQYSTGSHGVAFGWTGTALNAYVDGSSLGAIQIVASDRRLKSNIAPSAFDALAAVTALPVHTFDLRMPYEDAKPQHWDCGLIADEVERLIPTAYAPASNDKGYASLHLMPLVATLFKAVQQLAIRLEQLEARR
jgi:hypothetical protein